MDYDEFLRTKLTRVPSTGLRDVPPLNDALFPFQRDLVTWALRRGRCALFADTGLGKTRMQVEWAHHVTRYTERPTLILAPLSVAKQTADEAGKMGISVTKVADGGEVVDPAIYVTNYDRLRRFEGVDLGAVVLDESSIIKHHDSKTLGTLLERFQETPYKLAASATPAPNDYTELGTHAEFLGVCTRAEMLSEFFMHDGGDTSHWRLKKHARTAFWRWVSGWAAMVRKPSDLGYEDGGYDLPPLNLHEHKTAASQETVRAQGLLFAEPAQTLTERRAARKESLGSRLQDCVDLVNADGDRWVIWVELNDEQDRMAELLGDQCASIQGKDEPLTKENRFAQFANSDKRILLTKGRIFGWGLNMQFSHKMAFVGATDSYEMWYQCIRRQWRFGQRHPVDVHMFCSELEGNVLDNLKRKGEDAKRMGDELSGETRDMVRAEVYGQDRQTNEYAARVVAVPPWLTAREGDHDGW